MPGVDLHLGDCLEILPTLAADSVDAVVTDPPYGINFNKGYKSGSKELVHGDDGFSVMVFVDELM